MTLKRMDDVGIVVDDLAAAIAFFDELGLELEGERRRPWMLKTPGERPRDKSFSRSIS